MNPTYIKTIHYFLRRLKPWHDIICIVAALIIIAIAFLFFSLEKRPSHSGSSVTPEKTYTIYTIPNPFPGLPMVKVAPSSGAVETSKSDWGAAESPTFQVKIDKLASPSSTRR